jgi:hypothetical protein
VTRPELFQFRERINILEAIALMGLTPFANRDSVFIIRETNNNVNLPDEYNEAKSWLHLIFISSNDIIIVELTKKKAAANDRTTRNISLALAIISTIAVLYSIFRNY